MTDAQLATLLNIIERLYQSNAELDARFDATPVQYPVDTYARMIAEEFYELALELGQFSSAMLTHNNDLTNPYPSSAFQHVTAEFADLLVVIMGLYRALHTQYGGEVSRFMIDATQRVIEKNAEKTPITHQRDKKGKITRREIFGLPMYPAGNDSILNKFPTSFEAMGAVDGIPAVRLGWVNPLPSEQDGNDDAPDQS